MSWLELDDRILEHPKFIRAVNLAGSDAVHLWLGLRAYCGQLLTDGLIPGDMIAEVRGPRDARKRASALAALLEVNLLVRIEGDYSMHDFLEWSTSRDEVLARRESARDRKRRSRGGSQGVTPPSRRDSAVTPLAVTNPRARGSAPLLSSPLPSEEREPRAPARSTDDAESDPIYLPPGPITGHDLCRVFGHVRSRHVNGFPWQSVRVAGGTASTMSDAINADPPAREDIVPSMELLFSKAKAGALGPKSGEILRDGSFAFGAWCSRWTQLREELHGLSPADPDPEAARRAATRVRINAAVSATDEKLGRDKDFTPPNEEQQAEIRRLTRDLADRKAVAS